MLAIQGWIFNCCGDSAEILDKLLKKRYGLDTIQCEVIDWIVDVINDIQKIIKKHDFFFVDLNWILYINHNCFDTIFFKILYTWP